MFQYSSTVCGSSGAVPASAHAIGVRPWAATRFCAFCTKPLYCVRFSAWASSPPMCRYGPGVASAAAFVAESTNLYVDSPVVHSASNPGDTVVTGPWWRPSQARLGYAYTAAPTCPGMSISGITVMYREAA